MEVFHLCLLIVCTAAELRDQLLHFETLHHVDVTVRRKRSVDGRDVGTKEISFSAFGKDFNVVLMPGSQVLSADFQGTLVYKDGQTAPLYISENDFFTGHLLEDEDIKADAYTEDGLWTASIYGLDDVYLLEPSWRHLPPSDNHSMIVYRQSDIRWRDMFPDLDKAPGKRKKICRALHHGDEPDWELRLEKMLSEEEVPSRVRRDVPVQNTCHILAVADYTFFSGPGGGFPHRTANYIIQTMQRVNRIYRHTTWSAESHLTGMGMQVKELRIHPELTAASDYHQNGKHYNMNDHQSHWHEADLLKQFGLDLDLDNFCLAHLFTHRMFSDGVLGLAYIASSRRYQLGGICSSQRENGIIFNTGFSSTKNTKGNNLLTQEAMLVTTHGHNWGAEHDAETAECAPDTSSRGKFVMYPYAVSGYDENNNGFSPCSRRYISAALTTRSGLCFKEEESRIDPLNAEATLCGNGIINQGETCDGGGMALIGLDPCCSRDCKLIGNSTCSAANFECCSNCQMAPQNHLCRGASKELCQEPAFCTGFSLDCPMSESLKDNTPCIDEGKCVRGQCLDFCAYEGLLLEKVLKPCRCEDAANSCLRCCRSLGQECRPQNRSSTDSFLQDGRPCNYGYCEAGRCQKTSANMIQRLFGIIEHLDSSNFVAFMKSNIVGTIIVFSLGVWIPLSWTISCVDKHREKKSREQGPHWISNDALLYQSLQWKPDDSKMNKQGIQLKYQPFYESLEKHLLLEVVIAEAILEGPEVDQCADHGPLFSITQGCKRASTECKHISSARPGPGSYQCVNRNGEQFPEADAASWLFSGRAVGPLCQKPMRNLSCDLLHCPPMPTLPPASSQNSAEAEPIVVFDIMVRGVSLGVQSFCMTVSVVLGTVLVCLRKTKVMRSTIWVLLEMLLLGAILLYATVVIQYFEPTTIRCLLLPWCREVGFAIVYGVLVLKIYRILAEFQSRKAHRVHVRDKDLFKYLAVILTVVVAYMSAWTAVNMDHLDNNSTILERLYTRDDKLAYTLCRSMWWDYVIEAGEFIFLCFGMYMCYCVRSAPTEYSEGRFITGAICYEALMSAVFYVLRHLWWYELHPDHLFLMFFLRCQLTVTVVLVIILGPKLWYAHRPPDDEHCQSRAYSQSDVQDSTSPETMKLNVGISSNGDVEVGEISLTEMDPEDIRAELKRLYTQLQIYRTKTMRKDNPHISKRRGGRKQGNRRFSFQAFHIKHRHQHEHEHEHEMSKTPEESTNSAEAVAFSIEPSVREEPSEARSVPSVTFKAGHK